MSPTLTADRDFGVADSSPEQQMPARDSRAPQNLKTGVSVCIPAYNEADVIAETVTEAAATLATLPGEHEIVVVDDGSEDDTWEILQELAGVFPELTAIRHPQNLGIARAQETLVTSAQCQYTFHIGADRQWRMAEIPRLLARMEETDSDIVIGVRTNKQYTAWRKLVSASFNGLVALLWGKHFGDLGSIKLAKTTLWQRIPFEANSAFVHAQRLLIAYRNGARITTTPVEHLPRRSGESKFTSPIQALRALRELLRFRFSSRSRRPLDPIVNADAL